MPGSNKSIAYLVEEGLPTGFPNITEAHFSGGVLVPEKIQPSHLYTLLKDKKFQRTQNIVGIVSREDLTDKVGSLIATAFGGRSGVKFKKLDEEVRSRLVCQEWLTLKELEKRIEKKAATDTAQQSSKVGDFGAQSKPPRLPDALSGSVLHFQSNLFLHYFSLGKGETPLKVNAELSVDKSPASVIIVTNEGEVTLKVLPDVQVTAQTSTFIR